MGKNWSLQLPGHGTVTVVEQVPGPFDITAYEELRAWRGNQTLDIEELCGFFGYDAVFP